MCLNYLGYRDLLDVGFSQKCCDEEHVIKGDVAVIVLYSDGTINNVGLTLSYEVTADGMKYFG